MGGKVELNGWDKVFNGDGISIFTILAFTVHGTFLCLLILAVYLWDLYHDIIPCAIFFSLFIYSSCSNCEV